MMISINKFKKNEIKTLKKALTIIKKFNKCTDKESSDRIEKGISALKKDFGLK